MAVLLLIIGYLGCFAWLLRRRLRASALRQMPINERLHELGLGIVGWTFFLVRLAAVNSFAPIWIEMDPWRIRLFPPSMLVQAYVLMAAGLWLTWRAIDQNGGLRVALEARRQVPGLPVLVLSQYVEQLYACELLSDLAGGVGYLLKDRVFSDEAFVDALRTVAAGGTVIDPEVIAKLLRKREVDEPIAALSAREREVLELMAQGRSNGAIAQRLYISEKP